MGLFSRKAVAVDIGSTSVKVLEITKKSGQPHMGKFAIEPIAVPDVDSPDLLVKNKANAIKTALRRANIKTKRCITSVSGEKVLVRYIQMPKMPEEDLANAISWEAEEHIPFKIDDVNLDFVVLGDVQGSQEPKLDILLVCATKELIHEQLNILQRAGLQADEIDVDGFAVVNYMEHNCSPQTAEAVAIINIGASKTNINIYRNGNIWFSRDINIGGNSISEALVSRKGVSFQEAEEIKKKVPLPSFQKEESGDESPLEEENDSEIYDAIKGTVEDITGEKLEGKGLQSDLTNIILEGFDPILTEIKRSIQFFENQMEEAHVSRAFLSGGTCRFERITDYLEKELGVKVELLNFLTNVSVPAPIESDIRNDNLTPFLGVSMGMGLRKVVE